MGRGACAPSASPVWATAPPMDFAPSAALPAGIVPHPLLLCLPDTWREKERRFKPPSLRHGVNGLAGTAGLEELSTALCGDLGLPPRGPWASRPPGLPSHEGWSLGLNFLSPPLLVIWEPHLRFLGCLGMDDAPHSSQTSQLSNSLYLPELLCLLMILLTSSRVKLSLFTTCFIFCFLSSYEIEENRNSGPCHVTSLCKEVHLLLFDLRATAPEVND